jgi:6-phosphogluconolactonase (cycloisomerase 2 family)
MVSQSHRIVLATHARHIHFLSFETEPPALHYLGSKEMKEQPSWVEASPAHKDLIYVNSWIENKIFALKLGEDGGADIVSECESGGAGPTFMQVTVDRKGLMVVNVSTKNGQSN